MRVLLPFLACLSGCAPVAAPKPLPMPPSATAPLPLRLVGTEPFWGVLLKDGALSFDAVDRGAIRAQIASVRVEGRTTVFRTPAPNAVFPVAVRAAVTPGDCSDGMSDRTYPYSAVVEVDYAGARPAETWRGCGGPESLFRSGE